MYIQSPYVPQYDSAWLRPYASGWFKCVAIPLTQRPSKERDFSHCEEHVMIGKPRDDWRLRGRSEPMTHPKIIAYLRGQAGPTSHRTGLSERFSELADKRSDLAVRANGPACQPLGQACPASRRTALSENCSDRPGRDRYLAPGGREFRGSRSRGIGKAI
ncbi:hypothetical protein PSHT_05086 [Puccinia striiformis]|uniref:Uncharacterized protein n=2 Tax=Puccinia striiformis TaxID=27350 RepID=A0A0L0VV12_9BASI|nr:hypothetical protein PSTG_03799 [Puccinia striiformis f. sp. tritici PST-78]POW19041.1 hypothetical protein PSHT_05086 [Puccinia striiformis]